MLKIFKSREYKHKFINLLIPIAIQEAVVILASSIGVLLLGIKNQDAMSGVSIANNIFTVFNSIISGLIVAGNLLAAQYYGKKDINKVNQVFNLSLKVATIITIIFVLISEIFPTQILSLFAPNKTTIINYGVSYLRIFAISFLFRALSGMYFYILKNLNKTKEIMIITMLTLLLNVGLTSLFLFAFNLNELAAALGIIISRLIELILTIYFVNKEKNAKFIIKEFLYTDKTILKKFIYHFIPMFLCKVAWSVGSIMISVILGRLSEDIIAANALFGIARSTVQCISSGAGNAAGILLGQECGANKLDEAKEHGNEIIKFTLILGFIDMAIFMLMCTFSYLIGLDLTSDAKKMLIYMMIIYAPSFIFQTFNAVLLDGHYSAGGDTLFISLANSLPYWIIVVPLGFISLHFNFHPLLIFFIITSEEIVKNLPIMLRYKQYKWVRNIANENK